MHPIARGDITTVDKTSIIFIFFNMNRYVIVFLVKNLFFLIIDLIYLSVLLLAKELITGVL